MKTFTIKANETGFGFKDKGDGKVQTYVNNMDISEVFAGITQLLQDLEKAGMPKEFILGGLSGLTKLVGADYDEDKTDEPEKEELAIRVPKRLKKALEDAGAVDEFVKEVERAWGDVLREKKTQAIPNLVSAFAWRYTDKGVDFWGEINEGLEDMTILKEMKNVSSFVPVKEDK